MTPHDRICTERSALIHKRFTYGLTLAESQRLAELNDLVDQVCTEELAPDLARFDAVARIEELERQRDMLAAALREIVNEYHECHFVRSRVDWEGTCTLLAQFALDAMREAGMEA